MIFGMPISTLTTVHVVISLFAILAGFVVVYGLLTSKKMAGWTFAFLALTALTTLSGFLFPFSGFTPAIGVGIISTGVLIVTVAARYTFGLHGAWRWIYAGGAVLSLYLNVFVLIVQAFQKIPVLNAFAPTGTEPAFAATQGIVLLVFVLAGLFSLKTFRPAVA